MLDELLAKHLPNGAKYQKFGELATIVRGASPRPIKEFITEDTNGVNWIKIGDVTPGSKYITTTAERITEEGAKKSRFVKEGDFVLSNSMSFGRPYILQTRGCIHDGWLAISDFENNFTPDFLYHILSSNMYQRIMKQKAGAGGGVQNLNADIVRSIELPIVPIALQTEIVKILDEYSSKNIELIDTLNKELINRRVQYECYCDKVFDLAVNSGGTATNIKSVCTKTCSGGTPKTSHSRYYGGDIPWLRTQEVDWDDIFDTEIKITEEGLANSSAKLIPANCVIVAMYGATAAKSAINRIPLSTNQACCNLFIDTNITSPEYVFYWLKKEYKKLKALGRGSQDNLNADMVKNYPIILPGKDVQITIINRIDELTKMCESLISNIESEILLRKTQYEYYRDKLLTFAELKEG